MHANSDVLSRPPIEENQIAMLNYLNTVTTTDPLDDEPLLYRLEYGMFPNGCSRRTFNRVMKLIPHYKLENRKLFYRKLISSSEYFEILAKELRKDIILKAHLLGHFQTEFYWKSFEKFYWKSLERDTIAVIAKCKPCQENHGICFVNKGRT